MPNIPEPLADPLRSLRKGLFWLIIVDVVVTILGVSIFDSPLPLLFFRIGLGVFSAVFLFGMTRLLPNRPTDILYLRTFRTDSTTGGIRTSLEKVFDSKFRVSGIRDPRRRWPRVLRYMSYVLFTLKYANPQYLNLEAGPEWKGRLWRTLGEAKGAIIDIDQTTPAVEDEIRLCVMCMGLNRVLFVIRDSTDQDQSTAAIREVLAGIDCDGDIQIAFWGNSHQAVASFETSVANFGRRLPATSAGFQEKAREYAEHLPDHVFQESNRFSGWEIGIGLVCGTIGIFAMSNLKRIDQSLEQLVYLPFLCVWYALLWIHYISFRRNSGSRSRRAIAFVTIYCGVLLGIPSMSLACGTTVILISGYLNEAKVNKARLGAMELENSCRDYMIKHGEPPASLAELVTPGNGTMPIHQGGLEAIVDPWGRPYQYDPNHLDESGNPDPMVFSINPSDGTRIYSVRRQQR